MLLQLIQLISLVERVFSSGCISTASGIRRGEFDGKIASDRLLWQYTSRAAPTCVGECGRDSRCASVFYNKVSFQCQGHSITHSLTSGVTDSPNTRYYILPFADMYIGDECVTNADCVTVNAECRNETCTCVPGYSFSPKTHECLAVCENFGTDYMEVKSHYISKTNIETYEHVYDVSDCFTLCNQYTHDVCRSLEYGWTLNKCFLQNITKLDEPGRWYSDWEGEFNISYFQRDCD